jgi:RND superfamily putative drug exporter
MQGLYPGLQQAGQQGMSAAQQALAAAQGGIGGPAQQGAQTGVNLAQRYAQQAASPIQGEDLYQQAARRVMQQVQPGLAARGLEAGGAGAQALTEAQRDLAYQFAANQAQNRQATLQGLTGATSNLGNITQQGISGLENAAGGVQQAAQGQAAIGQSLLPFMQALQQGGQNVQSAAQGGAQIGMLGPQLAGQQASAINQLGQTLMQQYGLPMQATGQLLNILTAGTQPGLSMLEATRPLATPSSKGTQIL